MQFVQLIIKSDKLSYQDASDAQMCILGLYLTDDLSCKDILYVKEGIIKNFCGGIGNITGINIDEEVVTLYDPFIDSSEDETQLIISKKSFIHILDEWEKVCKEQPREVIITYNGDEFTFEKKF